MLYDVQITDEELVIKKKDTAAEKFKDVGKEGGFKWSHKTRR